MNETAGILIRVMMYLSESPRPVGIRHASRALGLSVARTYRAFQALRAERLVVRDAERHTYRLGLKVVEIANNVLATFNLQTLALPFMERLRDKTSESVSCLVAEGLERVCLASVESRQMLRIVFPPGSRGPLYSGAPGRVLLAFQPPDVIEAVIRGGLRPLTPNTITDEGQLRSALKSIRANRYAISHGERQLDISSIAAPICDHSGHVIASVAVFGPSSRCSNERLKRILPLLSRSAGDISALIRSEDGSEHRRSVGARQGRGPSRVIKNVEYQRS